MKKTVKLEKFDVAVNYSIDVLPEELQVINTINAYSWLQADENPQFEEALLDSDVLLPDGVSIVIAAKLLSGVKIKKVAGADLHKMLLIHLNKINGRCFYMGASDVTLQKIKQKLENEYPNIISGFYSPPFKKHFSEEDNQTILNSINRFCPDVVFVGMTAPKQELWIHENKEKIEHAKIVCAIGAVFDFYAETKKRPPKWMINIGLEWFGRLISEPKRLWRRYIIYNFYFCIKLFNLWKNKKHSV